MALSDEGIGGKEMMSKFLVINMYNFLIVKLLLGDQGRLKVLQGWEQNIFLFSYTVGQRGANRDITVGHSRIT